MGNIVTLARSFPTLAAGAPLAPWDPDALDRWASATSEPSSRHAAAFVLSVWSGPRSSTVGVLRDLLSRDLTELIDEADRAAGDPLPWRRLVSTPAERRDYEASATYQIANLAGVGEEPSPELARLMAEARGHDPPRPAGALAEARRLALEAREAYRNGDIAEAEIAAMAANDLAPDLYGALLRCLREPHAVGCMDVLRCLAVADVWRVGRFDAVTALKVWDDEHRAAFLAWAADPVVGLSGP